MLGLTATNSRSSLPLRFVCGGFRNNNLLCLKSAITSVNLVMLSFASVSLLCCESVASKF